MTIPAGAYGERLVLPSLLSADFGRLAEEIAVVTDAGARMLHMDVMDGHFVPNITIGMPVIAALSPVVHAAGALVDVHLMIAEPDRYLKDFVSAGADGLSVHIETCPHIHRTLCQIKELGLAAGLVLNPGTDVSLVREALKFADYVLVMSVNPGFGGQSFIPEVLEKVKAIRDLLPEGAAREIDRGIDASTIESAAEAGANWFVAGSAVYSGGDAAGEYRRLAGLAGAFVRAR